MRLRRQLVVRAAFVATMLAVTAPFALAALHASSGLVQPPGVSIDLGGRPLFDVTRMRPGVRTSRCITVISRSSGRIALYAAGISHPLDRYLKLTVTRVHGFGRSCARLVPNRGGTVFNGSLRGYPRKAGRALTDRRPPDPSGRRIYKFTVQLVDNSRAQGLRSTVSFSFSRSPG